MEHTAAIRPRRPVHSGGASYRALRARNASRDVCTDDFWSLGSTFRSPAVDVTSPRPRPPLQQRYGAESRSLRACEEGGKKRRREGGSIDSVRSACSTRQSFDRCATDRREYCEPQSALGGACGDGWRCVLVQSLPMARCMDDWPTDCSVTAVGGSGGGSSELSLALLMSWQPESLFRSTPDGLPAKPGPEGALP